MPPASLIVRKPAQKNARISKIKLASPPHLVYSAPAPLPYRKGCGSQGQVSEWSKEHDWKSCVRQNRTEGSNPSLSAPKLSRKVFEMNTLRLLLCALPGKKWVKRKAILWSVRLCLPLEGSGNAVESN